MTHRQIEETLGRGLCQDTKGTTIGLTLAEVALLDLVRNSWRRVLAEDKRIVRATLAVDRFAAGLDEVRS